MNNSKEQNMGEGDVFPDYCYHQISQRCGAEEHESALAPRWKWRRKNLHFSSSYRALFATAKKPQTVITLRSREIITIWLEVNLREVEEHIAHFFNLVQKQFFFFFGLWGKQRRLHSASNRFAKGTEKTMHINKANFPVQLSFWASATDYYSNNQYGLN